MAVGVHAKPRQDITRTPITEDVIYLLVSKRLLRERLPEQETCEILSRSGLSPAQLSKLPLAVTPVSSTVKLLIDQYFMKEQIAPEIIYAIDSYDAALQLCCLNEVAFFCPESLLLCRSFRNILNDRESDDICILKPDFFEVSARVELLTSRLHYLPGYVPPFGAMFVGMYKERIRQLRKE